MTSPTGTATISEGEIEAAFNAVNDAHKQDQISIYDIRGIVSIALSAAAQARPAAPQTHSDPHPRWKPNDKSDRHPQTIGEWDYNNDPAGGAFDRSLKRLNVACDYDDSRAPDQMAIVLRMDLSRLIGQWIHRNAFFMSYRTKPREEIEVAANAAPHAVPTGFNIGDKVQKIKGYPFRGTFIGYGTKSDGKMLAMVEIEPGPNAEGLVYLHPLDVLARAGVPPPHAVPAGWKIVPVEPTSNELLELARTIGGTASTPNHIERAKVCRAVVLAAAPTPPDSGVEDTHRDVLLGAFREENSTLCRALKHLVIAARTTGGVDGRDEGLCRACDEAERVLTSLDPYDELPTPPDSPRRVMR